MFKQVHEDRAAAQAAARDEPRARGVDLLWLDADTLLEEMAFQLPFSAYDGKNFIAWGNADYLWAGDQFHGECASRNIVAESRDQPTKPAGALACCGASMCTLG